MMINEKITVDIFSLSGSLSRRRGSRRERAWKQY